MTRVTVVTRKATTARSSATSGRREAGQRSPASADRPCEDGGEREAAGMPVRSPCSSPFRLPRDRRPRGGRATPSPSSPTEGKQGSLVTAEYDSFGLRFGSPTPTLLATVDGACRVGRGEPTPARRPARPGGGAGVLPAPAAGPRRRRRSAVEAGQDGLNGVRLEGFDCTGDSLGVVDRASVTSSAPGAHFPASAARPDRRVPGALTRPQRRLRRAADQDRGPWRAWTRRFTLDDGASAVSGRPREVVATVTERGNGCRPRLTFMVSTPNARSRRPHERQGRHRAAPLHERRCWKPDVLVGQFVASRPERPAPWRQGQP